MSDFLNQFEKDKYKSDSSNSVEDVQKPIIEKEEDKSNQRNNAVIQGPSHDIVIDKSFNKSRIIKYIIMGIVAVAICLAGFFAFRLANRITVKKLVDINLSEAQSWALKNRIEFNITYEFSILKEKDIIITQSPAEGYKLQKGSVMDITVSKGANPDEVLVLPNFTEMDISAIREWIKSNKAINVNVFMEYDEKIPSGEFLRMEFHNDQINESNYTRKEYLSLFTATPSRLPAAAT